jgi:hypothetical protein
LQGDCDHHVRVIRNQPAPPLPDGWQLLGEVRRPAERDEITQVLRRQPGEAR